MQFFGERYEKVYLAPCKYSCRCINTGASWANTNSVLTRLLPRLKTLKLSKSRDLSILRQLDGATDLNKSPAIQQSWIWKRLGIFTKPGDIIIAESGTAQFGFPDATLAPQTTYITQVYYGSIGYSVGAALGAGIAQREAQQQGRMPGGRTILVVGDGSLQLTVQEIGTMIRCGLSPIM